MTTTRADVVRVAREWMDAPTPFHHQAAIKGVGCDCIGLVRGVAAELGLAEAEDVKLDGEFAAYGREPDVTKLLAVAARYMQVLEPHRAAVGDVLLFNLQNLPLPMHFGIVSRVLPYSGVRYMIHSYLLSGRVVENVVDAKWNRRIARAYRLKGLT